jgi:hypothetical protein
VFEFPKRLELSEIVRDGCDIPVAAVVCSRAQRNAHVRGVGRFAHLMNVANGFEEKVLVNHHAVREHRQPP